MDLGFLQTLMCLVILLLFIHSAAAIQVPTEPKWMTCHIFIWKSRVSSSSDQSPGGILSPATFQEHHSPMSINPNRSGSLKTEALATCQSPESFALCLPLYTFCTPSHRNVRWNKTVDSCPEEGILLGAWFYLPAQVDTSPALLSLNRLRRECFAVIPMN